jgi:hypothetical protein
VLKRCSVHQEAQGSLCGAFADTLPACLPDDLHLLVCCCAYCRVEAVLKRCSAAVIWVTHDSQQPLRVGGRLLELPEGALSSIHPQQQQQQQQPQRDGLVQADGSLPHSSGSSSSNIDLAAAGQGESSLAT